MTNRLPVAVLLLFFAGCAADTGPEDADSGSSTSTRQGTLEEAYALYERAENKVELGRIC